MESQSGQGSSRGTDKIDVPFLLPSVNANSKFSPYLYHPQSTDSKNLKPPKGPDKPLAPYMRYSRKVWDSVKSAYPELKLWEIGKVIGQNWRELPNSEKQRYNDEYDSEKIIYQEALKAYHNSVAYQQYVAAKERVQKEVNDAKKNVGKVETKVTIQPCDDDTPDSDQFSTRNLAGARYQRNQKLLTDLFSDASVPDVRTVITSSRMNMLKRQVQSLNMHQQKLEQELEQLHEKFEVKKRCIHEAEQSFQESVKKFTFPAVDDKKFQEMVAAASEDLINNYQRFLERDNATRKSSIPPTSNLPTPDDNLPPKIDEEQKPSDKLADAEEKVEEKSTELDATDTSEKPSEQAS